MQILFNLIFLVMLSGCSVLPYQIEATNTPFPRTRPDDFRIEYYWETGSLPSPHFYYYEINIGPGVVGEIKFQADYSDQEPPIWIESIEISRDDMDELYEMLYVIGLFDMVWLQVEDIPDGGSATKLLVYAYGQEFTIPSFVAGEQQSKDAMALYGQIESLVSQEIWDKLMALHDQYVAENEED